jgi:predicted nucleic acid-binding protein
MTIVLDCSAAAGVVLQPDANRSHAGLIASSASVVAPELIVAELANTYWKYLRSGQLSRLQVENGFQQSLALIDDLCPLLPLSKESLELAALTRHPAYDTFYLVLAKRNNAILLTLDKSLMALAAQAGVSTA